MGRYVARRLLQFIPVLFGTMFLLHYLQVISIQINGNPITALFGDRQPPPETLAAITRAFGLDDPCLQQLGNPCLGMFVERLGNYLQFDFGVDFTLQPITSLLADAAPITIRLTLLAVVFESIVGIFAGVIAAIRRNGFADNFIRLSTTLLISVPIFVLGVLVQILSGLYIGVWLTDNGAPDWLSAMFSVSYKADYPWASLFVPAVVLATTSLCFIALLTRTSLIETLRTDYVRTARAKGLKSKRIIGVHALRNSLIPVITYIGIDIGALMGGAVVTEGIFNIPGIGGLVFQSVCANDTPVVIAVVTLLTMVFLRRQPARRHHVRRPRPPDPL